MRSNKAARRVTLYIYKPLSIRSILDRARVLCEEITGEPHPIEVVDIGGRPEAAEEENVIKTPTLIIEKWCGRKVRIAGDFTRKLEKGL